MMAPSSRALLTQAQYQDAMRERFHRDHEARQHMLLAARALKDPVRKPTVTFAGIYAAWAQHIIERICAELGKT
jgi:hypothetical protein